MKVTPMQLNGIVDAHASFWNEPYNGREYIIARWSAATFLVDFGPWMKGEEVYDLTYDPLTGVLTETNQDEHIVTWWPTRLAPA